MAFRAANLEFLGSPSAPSSSQTTACLPDDWLPRHRHQICHAIPHCGTYYFTLLSSHELVPSIPPRHASPPLSYSPRHRHRLCYPAPRFGGRCIKLPRRSRTCFLPTTTTATSLYTSCLLTTASASVCLCSPLRWQPRSHASLVRTSSVGRYHHHHHLPPLLIFAHHGIGVGFATRLTATAPAASNLLGGYGLFPS